MRAQGFYVLSLMLFMGIKKEEVAMIWEKFGKGKEYDENILHKNYLEIII